MKAIIRIIIGIILITSSSLLVFSQATLTIGSVSSIPGNSVSVPVQATDIADMTGFQFTIAYDKTKLTYTNSSNWGGGTNSAEVQITQSDGAVAFVYNNTAVNISSGKFFDLNFTILNGTSGSTAVTWSDTPTSRILKNSVDAIISCNYSDGSVNIVNAPVVGPITQPTCVLATGSVVLSGLPSSGAWILTRSPGNVISNGTGSETTISELPAGTYTYTVTDAGGATSVPSGNVTINPQPPTPSITNQTITILTGTTFTVTLTGVPVETTYTWTAPVYTGGVTGGSEQVNAQTSITGTLTIPSGTGTAIYTVTPLTGSCVGAPFTVTVSVTFDCIPVTIGTQPSDNSMCTITGNRSFTVVANGILPFTYRWEYNISGTWSTVTDGTPAGASYSNATTGTLGVSGITTPGSYQFRCYISNCSAASNATSNAATLTVNPPPSAPVPETPTQPTCSVATGSVVVNGLSSTGTWTLTRHPGGITTTGTGTSTTISGLIAGTYFFTVTNESGCISSASTDVIINTQPVTPVVPDQVALIQTGGTFTVTPSGVPPGTTYTWTAPVYTGGVTGGSAQTNPQTSISGTLTILSGSGTAVYTVTPVTGTCVGAAFTVTVTVSFDCVPVTIGTQPSDNSICATSGNASFTVIANGIPPYTYQWQYFDGTNWSTVTNGTPAGASYSNQTTNTLGVSGIISPGSYQFRCFITNCSAANNATSNAATLTVNTSLSAPLPEVPTQPTCSVPTGSVVLNGLPSSGTWTLTRNPGGITTTGTGTSTLISGLTEGTYSFTVNIAGGCISAASTDVIINSQPPTPVVTNQTTSINTGESFTVTPPEAPLGTKYTWSDPVYTGLVTGGSAQLIAQTSISGSLTIPAGTGSAVYTVTPVAGTCTGNTFTVTVIVTSACTPVTIGAQPSDDNMCAISGNASFTVIASGTSPYTYQWQYFDGVDWTNVSVDIPVGASYNNSASSSMDVSGIITAGTYQYRCIITNCTSITVTTTAVTLTVNESQTAPIPGTIVHPSCAVATGSVELSGLPATGTWTVTRNPGGIISSGTGTSTTISGLPEGTYTFTVENANGCISVASADVTINSRPPTPEVTNQTVSIQTGGTFTVTPAGVPPGTTYTWTAPVYTGGVTGGSAQTFPQTGISGLLTIPSGSGTAVYTVTPLSGSCTGTPFTVTVTVSFNCVPVTIGIQPTDDIVCSVFGEASFTVVPGGTSPFTYQWQYNNGVTWTNVSNETPAGTYYTNTFSGTLGASGFISAGIHQYRCIITNCASANSATSNSVTLTVNESPAAPIPETPVQPTCSVATGSVVVGGLPSTGTWTLTRNPGSIIITGTGTSTLISGLTAGTYYFTVTNSTGCVSSASADVIINTQPPTPNITNQNVSIQSGETFNVTPTGPPAGTTYTWTAPVYTGLVSGGSAQTIPQTSIYGTLTIPSGSGTAIYAITPVTGSCTGAPFTVTVNVTTACIPATISTQPSGKSFCAVTGEESFTVVATGTAPFTYQWQYNNGGIWTNVINGIPAGASYTDQNTPGLGVSGVSAPGIYQYSCYITNCTSGSVRSNAVTLTVNAIPFIPVVGTITQPTCTSPTASIVLNGLPASGTWTLTRNPGAVITTGTGTSTIISGLGSGSYSFTVTNAAGCISNSLSDVIINTQPHTPVVTDQTTAILSGGTFTVTPFGVPPGTTYTWTAPVYTGEVTGGSAQTNPQTSITGVLTIPSGSGKATYIVTPVTGSCTGTTFTLTVTVTTACVPVTIGLQPIGTDMCASSGIATFSIETNGTSPFIYQWQYNNGGLWSLVSNGTPAGATYSNPTTPNMSVTGISSAGTFQYRCYITNCTSNSVRSNVVTLTVYASQATPSIGLITQPTCEVPTGSVVLNGLPGSGIWTLLRNPGEVFSNGTGTSTTISGLAAGTYTFSVSTGSGCFSSASANVIINTPPPPLIVNNQTTSIQSGGTFSITPAGVPEGTTYTWNTPVYTGGVRGGSAQSIPQTSITGILTILSGWGTAVYTITPYSGTCPGRPFTATVTVTFNCIPVTIGNHPINKNMCPVTGEATFTVVTGGTTPYTYQWQYNNNGTWSVVSNGMPVGATYTNSTTMTLRVSGIMAAGNYQYRCYITNCTANTATSNAATLTVYPSPSAPLPGIPTQPTCSSITGSVVLSGLPSSGSWTIIRNPGGISSNGTGPNTTISGLPVGTYTFTVTNSSGCISNPSAEVVINANPATPSAPVIGTITHPTCTVPTGIVVLNGLPSSGTWTLTRTPGGITTTGNGSSTTIIELLPGTYSYLVTNASGCISAISANIVVNPSPKGVVPKIALKYGDVLICYNLGDSIRSYQWYNGAGPISDAKIQYYQTKKQSGTYKVVIVDNNGCSNSSNLISISGTKSISAYPNPASVSFTIKLNNVTEGKAIIRILSTSGTKIMEFRTEALNDELIKEIPVENLDEGIYFIQVLLNNKDTYYTKIVVAK